LDKKKKEITFTAFLTTLMALGVFIPTFYFINNSSPLGKWIEVSITCAETGAFVPDGLAVTAEGMGAMETLYTVDGLV